jgi:NAD(P)-dependent dehydrogenase (short-subunit alcohol dehydrogenase family)
MAKQGGGSIVNMGSGWGIKGGRNAVSYCASKGAVVNMTRAMAIDTCFEAPPEYREVQPEHFVACYRVEAG